MDLRQNNRGTASVRDLKSVRRFAAVMMVCMVLAAAFMFAFGSETTPPKECKTFRFVQICDPQLGYKDYEQEQATFRQAVRQVNALQPDFVVICGDLVQESDAQSFADFKTIRMGFEVPVYCVPGNHDVGNKPTSESLQTYRAAIGRDYYAVEHKGACFVFVNTQLWKKPLRDESVKQNVWLVETFRRAWREGLQIYIVGHFPLFTRHANEWGHYFNIPKKTRRRLLELFEQYQVVAVLSGHRHRLIVNEYNGIQMVSGETLCENSDRRPPGFRVWTVNAPQKPVHAFMPLKSK